MPRPSAQSGLSPLGRNNSMEIQPPVADRLYGCIDNTKMPRLGQQRWEELEIMDDDAPEPAPEAPEPFRMMAPPPPPPQPQQVVQRAEGATIFQALSEYRRLLEAHSGRSCISCYAVDKTSKMHYLRHCADFKDGVHTGGHSPNRRPRADHQQQQILSSRLSQKGHLLQLYAAYGLGEPWARLKYGDRPESDGLEEAAFFVAERRGLEERGGTGKSDE
ncbi:hypothetical protein F5144DRAFT_560197 [Chaetomium tenue]|uniref:Uncharacterized protein n=1 Tax=Chaetomium tenue TaxID=1854479 RepID=A0ACB7PEP1_9PEZI|nr:hypothetical protein F5144DRAFT_560197 [Chaetomium globosum]